jgi:predicted enzyme related to lactoylglutathione lyase
MDAFKTPGAISWSELTTPDAVAATAFYRELFGWSVESLDMGGTAYHVVKVGDTAIGGVMSAPPGAPAMPPSWGVYVTVEDCDAAVARCAALGGAVLMGPNDVPGVGRMAVLRDPQGALFSVIAYLPQP